MDSNQGTTGKTSPTVLHWPELIPGVLIRRYKRFMADVRLSDGQTVTAHCANSGAMEGCCLPGRPVYLSRQDKPGRKLKYTWEIIDMPASLVGVNTLLPNRLVHGAVDAGAVPELGGYDHIRREVTVCGHSRIDLRLENTNGDLCYVEVKNCSLVRDRIALFPDAQTARGLKHLEALRSLKADGHRCVMFYLIQRTDAAQFTPADDVDPAYGAGLRAAVADGVEILVYDVAMDLETIRLNRPIPYVL